MVLVRTKIDALCDALAAKTGQTATIDSIAKEIGISEEDAEGLAKTLAALGVVDFTYSAVPFAKPIIRLRMPREGEGPKKPVGKLLSHYDVETHHVMADVEILDVRRESRPIYVLSVPRVGFYTGIFLEHIRDELARSVPIETEELIDPRKSSVLVMRFYEAAERALEKKIPNLAARDRHTLAGMLLHRMYGLGDIELLMSDDLLEEIAVNGSQEPISVYHRKFGWCKTNMCIPTEEGIYNYASQVGRKSGRDITLLNPIMEAHLTTGDRVTATLFPISTCGATITIRRFAREQWTIIDFIGLNTLSIEMAAFLWECIQYEMNMLVAGGTASGKTSMLNTLCALIPPSSRTITIEDTKELSLPSYMRWNWVPLVTRQPNPEGKGEVTMLDLMVSSLRLRPDRIIVGEVRKRREAEVLFEAMHTGHAVYSTLHADTGGQVLRRLMHPPFAIPITELQAMQLILVMYRDRRKGWRRAYEISEVMASTAEAISLNTIWRWRARQDEFEKASDSIRTIEEFNLHTGMSAEELAKDLKAKEKILAWMLRRKLRSIEDVGTVMNIYYKSPDEVEEAARRNYSLSRIA